MKLNVVYEHRRMANARSGRERGTEESGGVSLVVCDRKEV